MEVAQNSVARWAIGASLSTPIAGLRGEMGWPTILRDIYKRIINYLWKLNIIIQERWPRKILEDMLRFKYGRYGDCKWRTGVQKAMTY